MDRTILLKLVDSRALDALVDFKVHTFVVMASYRRSRNTGHGTQQASRANL